MGRSVAAFHSSVDAVVPTPFRGASLNTGTPVHCSLRGRRPCVEAIVDLSPVMYT